MHLSLRAVYLSEDYIYPPRPEAQGLFEVVKEHVNSNRDEYHRPALKTEVTKRKYV